MRPRPGFALCLSAAALLHAVVLLVPRPAGREAAGEVPSVEVTLVPGPAGAPGVIGQSAVATAPGALVIPPQAAPAPVLPAAAAAQAFQVPAPPAETAELVEPTEPVEPTQQAGASPAAGPAPAETQPGGSAQPIGSSSAGPSMPSTGSASPGGGPGAALEAGSGTGGSGIATDSSGSGTGGSVIAAESDVLSAPRPLAPIHPTYPRAARRAGWQGVVRISALIGATGRVVDAEVARSSGHAILDEAALEAVRLTVFAPAMQEGKAVASLVIIPVRFQLN